MSTFDRPPERHSTPQGSPDRPPPPIVEPNEHPWLKGFGAAVPIYILMLIVVGAGSAYAAGELITPAILAALAAGGMAKESDKEWHWWTYLVAVAGVAAFLVGFFAFSQSL